MNTDIYSDDPEKSWYLVGDHTAPDRIVQGEHNAKMWGEGGTITSRSCGYRTEALLREHCQVLTDPCKECGGIVSVSFSEDVKKVMVERNICFTCWHWYTLSLKAGDPNSVRIDGSHYQIGTETGPMDYRGFAGRRFKIRFHDGREVETTNLWHQGKMTPPWKNRLPDNAEFVN